MKALELDQRPDQLVWNTKYFLDKDREALQAQGFETLNLLGKSFEDLFNEYPHRWYTPDYAGFKNFRSRNMEVAFDPNNFYLKGSGGKTLEEQKEIVKELERGIVSKGLNITMVIGEIADYAELALKYFQVHGKRLPIPLIRTATSVGDHWVFNMLVSPDEKVGQIFDIRYSQWRPPVSDTNQIDFDVRKPGIGIAPLIFPA